MPPPFRLIIHDFCVFVKSDRLNKIPSLSFFADFGTDFHFKGFIIPFQIFTFSFISAEVYSAVKSPITDFLSFLAETE